MAEQSNNRGLIFAVLFLVLMMGAGAYFAFSQSDEAEVAQETAPAAKPSSVVTPEPTETEVAEASSDPATPTFDEFRREPDGATVIAGRAAPGSTVSVMVDGEEIAKAEAGSTGSFALFATLDETTAAQVMTLETEVDGKRLVSEDEIILTPISAPKPDLAAPAQDTTEVAQSVEMPTEAEEVASNEPVETEVPVEAAVESADEAVAPPAPTVAQATQTPAAPQTEEPKAEVIASTEAKPESPAPPQAPSVAVLRSNADGVQMISKGQPVAMTQVELDTIGYSVEGEVQLAGRAQSEAKEVRIYLNNNAVVSLPVDAKGRWQGDVPNVDEGVYTLRVDEVAEDGKVSSRVETPFQRESASVLEAAKRDQDGNIVAITVQKGSTLWAIARERYGEGTFYVKVFEANKSNIRDPNLIYPGQIFDLPQ